MAQLLRTVLFLGCWCLYAGSSSALCDILIAYEPDTFPVSTTGAEGKPQGFAADLWTLWSEGANVSASFVPVSSGVSAVVNGSADVVVGPADLFAGPLVRGPLFARLPIAVFTHESLPEVRSTADLAGYVVGVVQGGAAEKFFRSEAADMHVQTYSTLKGLLGAVQSGRLKVFAAEVPQVAACVEASDFPFVRGYDLGTASVYVWHARDNTRIAGLLERGLNGIDRAEWDALAQTWDGYAKSSSASAVWMMTMGCVFVALGVAGYIGVLLWRRRAYDENIRLHASMRALRQSENRFEKAFHSSPAPQIISDIATGRLIDVNQRWVEMIGYSKEEQIGRTSVELGVWQCVADRRMAMQLLAERGAVKDRAVCFVTRQGQLRYTLWSAEIIILDGQAVLLSLILDDTERRKSEDALRKSESLYRSVIENIQDVFYRTDTEGNLIMVSPSALRVFGYSSLGEVLGQSIASFWWKPSDRQQMLEKIQQDGRVQDYEVKVRHSDESPRFMATSSHFYRDESGEIRGVEGTFRDITERKRAEEEVRQSEEKFYRLFKLSPDAICLTELRTGRFIDVNDALTVLSGFHREDLIGRTSVELGLLPDGVRTCLVERLAVDGRIKNREIEIPRRDSSVIYGSLSCQLVVLGGRQYILAVLRDLTEIKRMQEVMIQTEKMISVGGIAAGIAHEINNPLGIIVQNAQNLELRTRPGFRKNMAVAETLGLDMAACERYMQERGIYKFIGDIQDAARRAADIIRHMMEFSRKSDSSRAVCELPAIVNKAVTLAGNDYDLRKSYDFRQIRVIREYNVVQPSLTCAETEIEQVVLNLLRNAAQAMAASVPPVENPTIVIRISETLGFLRLEIEDNGPGISPELQAKIFEPFFTTKPPGVGTGLGLSVSYFIITRGHGGEMTVASRPGRGSTFVIDLPRECRLEEMGQAQARIQ